MNRKNVVRFLRGLRLIFIADYCRFLLAFIKNFNSNKIFLEKNKQFIPPPYYINFETTNSVNLVYYNRTGKQHQDFIENLIDRHYKGNTKKKKILEWGCGTSRVLRHFSSARYDKYGVDYNSKSIKYNEKHLLDCKYECNSLNPPLKYPDSFFDVVYSISVFTHLSSDTIAKWLIEMGRILKVGGLHIFTAHGNHFKNELNSFEKVKYEEEGFLNKSQYKEGKKWFTSYTHKNYFEKLCSNQFQIAEYIDKPSFDFFFQDFYIVKKMDYNFNNISNHYA